MVFSLLIFVLLTSIPTQAAVSIKTFERWQEDYAVVIAVEQANEYKPFCSGTITQEGIVTAAHCCAVGIMNNLPMSYSLDGEEYREIRNIELDLAGQDICILEPVKHERSPIKIGSMPRWNEAQYKRDYINISKISIIYGKEELTKHEVQNVYFLSLWDENPFTALFRGHGMPGMSGSAVIDTKGNLVGVLIVGLFNDRGMRTGDRSQFIDGVFGAALIEMSMWGVVGKRNMAR